MAFFGNLMNNYFYGKSGKGDYRIEDMPQNRFQLFGAVLKTRWSAMVGVNLLYVLFWLPAAAWTLLNYITLVSGAAENVTGLFSTYLLILIPLIALTGPFTAGATYVLRNWARDEHSFVWSDFWDAVKGNWKQALVVSVISGLMPYMLFMGYTFYGTMASTKSFVFMIPLALLFLVFIVWKLSEMIIYTLMVTYDLKTKDLIRNAILLTVGNLPLAVGVKLLTLVFPIIAFVLLFFIPSIELPVILVFCLLYLIYIPAFNRLITCSYSNALCEKYLNSKIGAPTNIGLRPENWDDTEYRPEDDE